MRRARAGRLPEHLCTQRGRARPTPRAEAAAGPVRARRRARPPIDAEPGFTARVREPAARRVREAGARRRGGVRARGGWGKREGFGERERAQAPTQIGGDNPGRFAQGARQSASGPAQSRAEARRNRFHGQGEPPQGAGARMPEHDAGHLQPESHPAPPLSLSLPLVFSFPYIRI